MEKKTQEIYNALVGYRKAIVNARCMADSPDEAWRMSNLLELIDDLNDCLKDMINN